MHVIPQIIFRDIPQSAAILELIGKNVSRLSHRFPHLKGCRVLLEAPHRHHYKGRVYHVHLRVDLPGREIVISRGRERGGAHEDLYVAIQHAFDIATRRLRHFASLRRRSAKRKNGSLRRHGLVLAEFTPLKAA
jgi:ribosome-associated translation inhibitor RaiA